MSPRSRNLQPIAAFLVFPVLMLAGDPGIHPDGPDAGEAMKLLMEGNRRFVEGHATHPHQSPDRIKGLRGGQSPFAAILCCGDSRVVPEIVFDQGLGDLFVVRVAGNVEDEEVAGSLGYAVGNLHSKVLMVLGHESCGAVHAACDPGHAPDYVKKLVDAIEPAVSAAKKLPGDLVENAVRENIKAVVAKLMRRSVVADAVGRGELRVVGAYYDLDTGAVELLP